MYVKNLEQGTFEHPAVPGDAAKSGQLSLLLQRARLVSVSYRNGRDSSGPIEALSGFKGILQTDGHTV
jgi:hypothetical protein